VVYFSAPTYVATSVVLVDPTSSQSTGSTVVVQPDEIATQIQVVASEPVAQLVKQQLGLPDTPATLLRSVAVSQVDVTRALSIEVRRSSASQAANIANAFATQYLTYRYSQAQALAKAAQKTVDKHLSSLQNQLAKVSARLGTAGGGTKVSLQISKRALLTQLAQASSQLKGLAPPALDAGHVLRVATPAAKPASPRPIRLLVLGGFIGLILGVCLAYLRDRVDDALRDETRLREVLPGRPVLGYIPHWPGARGEGIATMVDPHSAVTEAYRSMSTNVRFLLATPRSADPGTIIDSTLLVTSPAQGEGRTTVAANLAVAAARVGLHVILVDTDLRNPALAKLLGLGDQPGLSDALASAEPAHKYLLDSGVDNLRVLPGGSKPPNPAELLASAAAHSMLVELQEDCDLLILDSAPILPVADSLELMPSVDVVLMVARRSVTRLRQLAAAADRVERVGATVSGVVYNDVTERDTNISSEYYQLGKRGHRGLRHSRAT
jgi:capsular exopolysaccharide synthesis family protein